MALYILCLVHWQLIEKKDFKNLKIWKHALQRYLALEL